MEPRHGLREAGVGLRREAAPEHLSEGFTRNPSTEDRIACLRDDGRAGAGGCKKAVPLRGIAFVSAAVRFENFQGGVGAAALGDAPDMGVALAFDQARVA
ncbi:hypothetical protein GCM10022404_01720 [Celeribacter arenosi]|uniref:Uncharacterized protein n=1 Tax=Celeribacter arenosi TaxID=792649 RepID=A0ABP7JVC8_9RHOB